MTADVALADDTEYTLRGLVTERCSFDECDMLSAARG